MSGIFFFAPQLPVCKSQYFRLDTRTTTPCRKSALDTKFLTRNMLPTIDMIGQSGTRGLEHAAMRAKAKSPKQMNVVIVDSLTNFATSLVYHGALLLKSSSSNIHGGNKLKRPNLPFGLRSVLHEVEIGGS
ncbi:hypothetical protein Tco_1228766 [Tanacetum coccineum]